MAYYKLDKIDATGANYRIIISQRSIGKTTVTLLERCIEPFFEDGTQFVYVRRRAEAIKPMHMSMIFKSTYVSTYIANLALEKRGIQGAEIHARGGQFILYGLDEDTGNLVPFGTVGYYRALVQGGYAKGEAFPDTVRVMLWDEFLSREDTERELDDELATMMNMVSTVKRNREDFVIYMLGNTVTRNSQILSAMKINMREVKPGDVTCYEYLDHNSRGELLRNTVAVEMCDEYAAPAKSDSFFVFGTQREMMIRSGKWETDEYALFDPEALPSRSIAIALVFATDEYRLYGYITGEKMLHIAARRLPVEDGVEYITLTLAAPTYVNRNQYAWHAPIPNVARLRNLIKTCYLNGHIVFDDNLTGDDFSNFLHKARAI